MYPYSEFNKPNYTNNNKYNYQETQHSLPSNYHPINQPNSYLAPPSQSMRGVYTSMIQPQAPLSAGNKPSGGLLGKLETMGRRVQQQPDPVIKINEVSAPQTPQTLQVPNTINFRAAEKPKMSASYIFPKTQEEIHNNFQHSAVQGFGTTRLDSLLNRNKVQQQPRTGVQQSKQTPEQIRKRQIESIRSEVVKLNKKIQNFNFKKRDDNNSGDNKPYFQLPTRKTQQQQPTKPQEQETNSDPNFGFFKTYSEGLSGNSNSTATTNTNYGSSSYSQGQNPINEGRTNQLSGNNLYSKSNIGTTFETTNKQPQNYLTTDKIQGPTLISHSLSDNNLRPSGFSRKEDPPGMFKKKSPFQLDNYISDNAPTAKKFLLSPKAANPKMEFPPKPPTSTKQPDLSESPKPYTQFKSAETLESPKPPAPIQLISAETVEPEPVKPKKGFKRIDSIQADLPPTSHNQPKQFTKDDFAIGKKLGKGQFGEVMLVIHKATGFLCGMKVMSKKQIREEKYVNQVARELAIQFYLNHRNVSPLYGFFEDKENVYLLVEFATGGQLLQLLRKAHRMEEAQCSPIIRQICEGLDYIHKEQIIHRDVKPENILFNFDTVKICDFGWAVYNNTGMRNTVAGSPLYYSPEIVQEEKYNEKIDIWSIGMMAYECILGKIPFRIYSELDLQRIVEDEIKFPEYIDVTEETKDFILKICKKDPDERMDMRDILRHPFITKYLNEKKVSGQILQEFKKVLNG